MQADEPHVRTRTAYTTSVPAGHVMITAALLSPHGRHEVRTALTDPLGPSPGSLGSFTPTRILLLNIFALKRGLHRRP